MKVIDTKSFIKKASQIHDNFYDYSKVNYVNSKTKVIIICPIHGEFEQTPENHLRGHGCRICAEKQKAFNQHNNTLNYRTIQFIQKSKEIHGNKYDYSKVNYINTHTKVCIICPKHGEFYQEPNNHLKGQGCSKCSESHGEMYIRNYLNRHKIPFESQKQLECKVNQSGYMYVDFYFKINNVPYIIEFNGKQHYQYIPHLHHGNKLEYEKQIQRDEYLRNFCQFNKINLIEIKYDDNVEVKLNTLGV